MSPSEKSDPGATEGETPAAKSSKRPEIEALRSDLNSSAADCGKLWLTYLFFVFYLTVSVGAVTHLDLFLEQPVKMPVLNVELPLVAFFCLAPIFLLLLHAYVLVNFVALSNKASQLRERLAEEEPVEAVAEERGHDPRRMLSGNVFVQYLAGPEALRVSAFGRVLLAIAWGSLALAPALLLLLVQMQFLPYQLWPVTWLHRFAVAGDILLLWWLWSAIVSCRRDSRPADARIRAPRAAAVAVSVATVLFSFVIAGGDDEIQGDLLGLRGVQNAIFRSQLDADSGRPKLPFSNRLALANVNIAELAAARYASTAGKTDYALRVRKRSLRGAVFDHAILTRADFKGAQLEGASFYYSQLDNSIFDEAVMQGAVFWQSTARGVSFEDAQLASANFRSANLAGADFVRANLVKAEFENAGLRGVEFYMADLSEASLTKATIFGSSFKFADLTCANLAEAEIRNSDFGSAELDSASLTNATLVADDFTNARLGAASAAGATAVQLNQVGFGVSEERASVELGWKFAAGWVADPQEFRAAQADLFETHLCTADADDPYIIKGVVFASLTGRRAIEVIDRLLGFACVTSDSLNAEQLVNLRSRRVALMQSVFPKPGLARATGGEDEAKARVTDVAGRRAPVAE